MGDALLTLLRDSNTRTVLVGASLLGVSCGAVGAIAMFRKRALLGDAIAHASLPGVALAYMVVGERSLAVLLLGAVVMGLLASAFIAVVRAISRVKEDAAMAIVIGCFFGLGIVLTQIVQRQPGGSKAGLDTFIFGKAASMVQRDAVTITVVAAVALGAVVLLAKEFKTLCFDAGYAASLGWHTLTLDLALVTLVCLCTVSGLPAVGVVLVVALLVIPPAAARFWSDRFGVVVALSGGIGLLASAAGTIASATLPVPSGTLSRGWPTGPLIALSAGACFLVSLLASPRRGLVADVVRRVRMRAWSARDSAGGAT